MDLYIENNGVAPVLRTPRLTLRPFATSDRDRVVAALSNREVSRWLTGVPHPYGPADFDWFLGTFVPETHHLVWAIDAGDGIVGTVGVKPDLGYWLSADQHGKGYMTEAAGATVAWYFERRDAPLISGYHLGNAASANVLRKLGFRNTFVNDVATAQGQTVRIQRMELTRSDWERVCG